jgi:hypothetical protein
LSCFAFMTCVTSNVTALRELGMDGKLRSVVTGHTDTRTTERIYDHVRSEHVEAAAQKFDPLAAQEGARYNRSEKGRARTSVTTNRRKG